jgi:hypothetical protein
VKTAAPHQGDRFAQGCRHGGKKLFVSMERHGKLLPPRGDREESWPRECCQRKRKARIGNVPTGPGISAEPLCGGAANWRRARDYRVSTLKLCSSCTSNFGAVSFLHRFGSALEAHVHLHVCATEGVFVPPADGARCDTPPAFLPARPINQADLAALGV